MSIPTSAASARWALFYLYVRLGLVGTILGLLLGHAILAVPYVILTVRAVLKTYDERLD